MSIITIQPNTWTELYAADEQGSFRVLDFKAKVLRATSLPTGEEGLTITEDFGPLRGVKSSAVYSFSGDGVNRLYILNMSEVAGSVEKDK